MATTTYTYAGNVDGDDNVLINFGNGRYVVIGRQIDLDDAEFLRLSEWFVLLPGIVYVDLSRYADELARLNLPPSGTPVPSEGVPAGVLLSRGLDLDGNLEIEVDSVFGINSNEYPYWNPAGAASGEEAVVEPDRETGYFEFVSPDGISDSVETRGGMLSYNGAPPDTFGLDGDYCIDDTSFVIYGPKANGSWGHGESIIGPTGAAGAPGSNGTNGATGPAGPLYSYAPADHGLLAWSGSVNESGSVERNIAAAGVGMAIAVKVPVGITFSKIRMWKGLQGTSGSMTGAFIAVYQVGTAAPLGQTADLTAQFVSATLGAMDFALTAPVTAAVGDVLVLIWWTGTGTTPQFLSQLASASPLLNDGRTAANFRAGTAGSGLTTTAPNPIGTITAQSTAYLWVGLKA